jgi:hypothetical protein
VNRSKTDKEAAKLQKLADKEELKYIKNNLTLKTIRAFGFDQPLNKSETPAIEYRLDYSLSLVSTSEKHSAVVDDKNIRVGDIDQFIFSGKLNSVLGPSGFKIFKDKLKDILNEINKGMNKENFINLDDLVEVLLKSGVYYNFTSVPEGLEYKNEELGWLTAYRFLAKNFKTIDYKFLRTLSEAIKRGNLVAIEFSKEESKTAVFELIKTNKSFIACSDAKDVLPCLSMSELKDIAEKSGAEKKRSRDEQVIELLKIQDIQKYVNNLGKDENATLIYNFKNKDLIKLQDIIYLDKYLREISKCIRNDLFDFVETKKIFKKIA